MTAFIVLSWFVLGVVVGVILATAWDFYFFRSYPDKLLQEYERRKARIDTWRHGKY